MVCGAMAGKGGEEGGGGGGRRSGISYGPDLDHPYDPPRAMVKLK